MARSSSSRARSARVRGQSSPPASMENESSRTTISGREPWAAGRRGSAAERRGPRPGGPGDRDEPQGRGDRRALAHHRVLDDVEGLIDIFACVHRSDRGTEADLIVRHDRIIDRWQEQATPAYLVAEVIQKFAVGPNHDRHDKAAGAAGVHANFVQLRPQVLAVGPEPFAQVCPGLRDC